jgi:hypothetical protein
MNITKLYTQLLEGKTSKEYFVRQCRTQFPEIISPVSSYTDIVSILKGKRLLGENLSEKRIRKPMINEVHELDTYQILDRLNPYAVKQGIEVELSKETDLKTTDLEKIKEKVAKKLQKDPNAYRDTKDPSIKDVLKQDQKLAMQPVKANNLNDKDNEMKKPKGVQQPKSNTSAPTKENKKGKPEGVKELGYKSKSVKGVANTMEITGKEKVLKSLKESLKKNLLSENGYIPEKRNDYSAGQKIVTPQGHGTITEVNPPEVFVKLATHTKEDEPIAFTFNQLDYQREYEKSQDSNNWDRNQGKEEPDPLSEKKNSIIQKIKEFLSKKKLKKEEVVEIPDQETKKKTTVITPNTTATAALTKLGGKVVPGTKGIVKLKGQS